MASLVQSVGFDAIYPLSMYEAQYLNMYIIYEVRSSILLYII